MGEQLCEFYKELDGIYRLRVPFDKIYTSVFLLISNGEKILVDCATTSEDVDGCIVPALRLLGFELSDISYVVISHKHGDHAGGLARVLELAPDIEVVREVAEVADGISTYPLAGHTTDCIGVLDLRTNTLISCDGLQGEGVDKYRCSLKDKEAYFETVERIRRDEKIENVLFSHAYEPWYSDRAVGREAVLKCLADCLACVSKDL